MDRRNPSPLFPEGKDECPLFPEGKVQKWGLPPPLGAPAAVQSLDPGEILDLAAITCRKRRNTMLQFLSGKEQYHQG